MSCPHISSILIECESRARFRFSQKLERGALGLAGAQAAPFRVWVDDWSLSDAGAAPAERFRFADGIGEIGLISSVSEPFCGTCNRLRLTADGALRNCLFSDDEQTVREVLRSGGTDLDLSVLFREAVWAKFPGHGINEPGFLSPARSMSMIGG